MVKRQPKSITRQDHGLKSLALVALITLSLQICLAALISSPLQAETQYVIPSSEIPVRRGQGNDYKIVALISDGTKVEVIERGDSYSLVRLDNEKQGWILTRFLSDDPPLTEVVATLTSENEAIKLQEQQSIQKQQELSQALAETEQKLETTDAEKTAITASFEKLKKDTANVVEIKKKLTETVSENKSIKQKLTTLTRENEELISDDRINWFLAGGGVLLLGIIIGKITSRSRKRKPSLL